MSTVLKLKMKRETIIFLDCCFTSITVTNAMAVEGGISIWVVDRLTIQLSGLFK